MHIAHLQSTYQIEQRWHAEGFYEFEFRLEANIYHSQDERKI